MKLISLAVFVLDIVVGLIIGSLTRLGEANAWLYGGIVGALLGAVRVDFIRRKARSTAMSRSSESDVPQLEWHVAPGTAEQHLNQHEFMLSNHVPGRSGGTKAR